jgi:hypothetical protein
MLGRRSLWLATALQWLASMSYFASAGLTEVRKYFTGVLLTDLQVAVSLLCPCYCMAGGIYEGAPINPPLFTIDNSLTGLYPGSAAALSRSQ